MSNQFWDLDQPRGRLLPALLAGLAPVLVAMAAVGLLLVAPAFRAQARDQQIVAAAVELRSASRALQRDALLLIFDADSREKTGGRVEARIPAFHALAADLESAMAPIDAEKAKRLRATHEALADGFAALLASVRGGAATVDSWRVQQERILANEIPAARANDPVILEFQGNLAASTADLRMAFWLSLLASLASLGFGVASAAVVLRR